MKSNTPRHLKCLTGALILSSATLYAEENLELLPDNPSEPFAYDGGAVDLESDEDDLFSASVLIGARYDSNVFLTNSDTESDIILTLAPTLTLANDEDAENTWSASYTPSARYNFDNSDNDGVDHHIALNYGKRLPKTDINAGVEYRKKSGTNQYVSGFYDEEYYGANFTGSYFYTGKTRLTLDLNLASNEFGSAAIIDRTSLTGRVSALYQATGKINLGPYISYSQVDVATGADHAAVGAGARLEYSVTGKTQIVGLLGYENRSFSGSGASGSRGATTFEFGVKHQYSAKTNFDATLFRNVQAGYSATNSGFTATGVRLGSTYAATEKINLKASAGYENNEFYAVGSGAGVLDDRGYLTLTFGSDYQMSDRWLLAGLVSYRKGSSDLSTAEFNSLELSINATYQF